MKLTEVEFKVLLFVIVLFFVGLILSSTELLKNLKKLSSFVSEEYSSESPVIFSIDEKNNEKKFDSNREVLDFRMNNNYRKVKIKKVNPQGKINLNKAQLNDLINLPGIGKVSAKAIIEYRRKHGSFKNLKELLNIKGIGLKRFIKLKKLLYIK